MSKTWHFPCCFQLSTGRSRPACQTPVTPWWTPWWIWSAPTRATFRACSSPASWSPRPCASSLFTSSLCSNRCVTHTCHMQVNYKIQTRVGSKQPQSNAHESAWLLDPFHIQFPWEQPIPSTSVHVHFNKNNLKKELNLFPVVQTPCMFISPHSTCMTTLHHLTQTPLWPLQLPLL